MIADINPDILILQEIEDRTSLSEFNEEFLPKFDCNPFQQIFVVQGNDKRGQETGILTRKGFDIQSVRSHSYNLSFKGQLFFKKDFVEYEIRTSKGHSIWILAIHLQERTEDIDLSDDIREKQAIRIAEVYNHLYSEGKKHIAVLGTLNAVSYCYSLTPILLKTNLKDVTKHPTFKVDVDKGKDAEYHSLGAYRMGVNIKQRDYLLLSPELLGEVKTSGLNRKGIWPEKEQSWSVYSTILKKNQEASEHPAIWAEFNF